MLLKVLALFSGPVAKVLFARLAAKLADAEKRVKQAHAMLEVMAKDKHKAIDRQLESDKEGQVMLEVHNLGL